MQCRECGGTGVVPDNRYDSCDTAVAHGPGHQSISACEVEGPHTSHYANGYDWDDKDLSDQTYTKWRYVAERGKPIVRTDEVLKVYRLFFSSYSY